MMSEIDVPLVSAGEFAKLLQRGPETNSRYDITEWFETQRERDAQNVYNFLRTPDWLLELASELAQANALSSNLFSQAKSAVDEVPPFNRAGSENVWTQAAAFRKLIPFITMYTALCDYLGEPVRYTRV